MNDLGIGFDGDEFTVLFGNRNFLLSDFQQHFSEWSPVSLHQVHGNQIVEQGSDAKKELSADAHYTSKPHLALVIKTADCLPVFIWNRKQKIISGIHAGWRGVENEIISRTIEKISSSSERANLEVWIGPHISESSFEVGSDVLEKFQTKLPGNFSFYEKRGNKFYIDLQKIVFFQLEKLGVSKQQVHTLNIDTKTDSDFYSHRRKPGEGRNYSFIVLK